MSHPTPSGEKCQWIDCHFDALHKVGEEGMLSMHNLTTYLCCNHMVMAGMDCQDYPYKEAMTPPEVQP